MNGKRGKGKGSGPCLNIYDSWYISTCLASRKTHRCATDLVVWIAFQYLCTHFNALLKSPAAEKAVGHVERVHLCPTLFRGEKCSI